MEDTLENKAKFFAQYWGQNILSDGIEVGGNVGDCEVDMFLELKPISLITDEDAIRVIKICEGYSPENILFRDKTGDSVFSPAKWKQAFYRIDEREVIVANFSDTKNGVNICNGNDYWRCHIHSLDFLRSKGYALPYLSLSVEQQMEYGWIKLQTT